MLNRKSSLNRNSEKKFATYFLAAILPFFFMGSSLTFTPFACMQNTEERDLQNNNKLKETIEKEFKIGKGKKLEINLKSGGALEITGWNKDLVHVKAIPKGRDADDINIDFEETSSGLFISSSYDDDYGSRSGGVNLEINVPEEFNLEIETMGGGITLDNINVQ